MDLNPHQELSVDSDPTSGDEMEVDTEPLAVDKSPSLPCFLKRVMEAEEGLVKVNLGLVAASVHAVFLDSGFVVSDGSGSRLPEGWASATSMVTVEYTVPELLASIEGRDVKGAVLRLSVMEKFVLVYGSLSGESSDVYRLCLDVSKLAPLLISSMNAMSVDQDKEIFQFWKIVKDRLSLPLMVDLCEKNGLHLPSCFSSIPADLKIMVLDLLPGADVARISLTNSEMRYLALNEDLWKKKFVEEFGLLNERVASSWKNKFVRSWVRRKNANKRIKRENVYRMPMVWVPAHITFGPERFTIIGGYYDWLPAIGGFGPNLWGPGLGFMNHPARRNFPP